MRTITCPDCGLTWTCPDFCYPGCHAIDPACKGPEYCRRCTCVHADFPDVTMSTAMSNWHSMYEPIVSEPEQLELFKVQP